MDMPLALVEANPSDDADVKYVAAGDVYDDLLWRCLVNNTLGGGRCCDPLEDSADEPARPSS